MAGLSSLGCFRDTAFSVDHALGRDELTPAACLERCSDSGDPTEVIGVGGSSGTCYCGELEEAGEAESVDADECERDCLDSTRNPDGFRCGGFSSGVISFYAFKGERGKRAALRVNGYVLHSFV